MPVTFEHQHAAHCETGVMSSMLKHHGVDISEAMALGLSSSIAFAYLPIIKISGLPLIAYRMPPKSVITGLQKRLGLKITFEKFSSPEIGMQRLDEKLAQGEVVGLQTSVFYLPYFPDEMRFHFNAHNLIVYGKEGNDYLISDPVAEVTVKADADSLKKARFAKGALAPKGMMYYPEYVPSEINLEKEIPTAIKKNVRTMTPPIPVVGVRGICYLAKKVEALDTKNDAKRAKLYLGHIVRMQEEIGTGGGGFRFIYAAFLQEASHIMNSDLLADASQMMTEVGDQWRLFALDAVKMCKKRSDMDVGLVANALRKCADKEAEVWKLLKTYRAL